MTPLTGTCPTAEQLVAAIHGDGDEHLAHARTCTICAARLREERELDELLDALPDIEEASEDRVADVREAILEKFATQKRRRPLPVWAAAAALLIAGGAAFAALGARLAPNADGESVGAAPVVVQRGSIHDLGGAHVVRHGVLPDEIVRVNDGAVLVEVNPLEPGERFRVVTGDAEIEVHGTVFEVRTENDELQSLRVLHGAVEVRFEGADPVMLHDGERWTRPAVVDPAAVAPATAPVEPTVVAAADPVLSAPAPIVEHERSHAHAQTEVVTEASRPPSAGESDFVEGWRLLRAGEHREAADAFARATREADDLGLAEDAAYWQASALRQAGSDSAATRAWEAFVSRFPASPRADEAAVHIGRARAREQRWDDARRWFERASDAADERIRAAATEGLGEIAGR